VTLPSDKLARKRTPIATGVLAYFPDALAAVAGCSLAGNEQHAPGEPLHWVRDKSTDHADCIVRHLVDHLTGDQMDSDGVLHIVKVAWRALAEAQLAIEARQAKENKRESAQEIVNRVNQAALASGSTIRMPVEAGGIRGQTLEQTQMPICAVCSFKTPDCHCFASRREIVNG
jgi:hypothetical protein